MRRYLVVANQTLGAARLRDKVRECQAAGSCTFHIVVPATPPNEHLTWVEGDAAAIARARLQQAVAWFRELGAEVDGEIGDASPLLAIGEAFRDGGFDEIILSTLPARISRWLKMDLPSRVMAAFDVPVTHIVSPVRTRAMS